MKAERVKDLSRVAEYLMNNPDKHDQEVFGLSQQPYGTVGCIAGTYVMMFPDRFPEIEWQSSKDHLFPNRSPMMILRSTTEEWIGGQVARDLGLTPLEADQMFLNEHKYQAIENLIQYIRTVKQQNKE